MAKIRIIKNKCEMVHEWGKSLIASLILNVILVFLVYKGIAFMDLFNKFKSLF